MRTILSATIVALTACSGLAQNDQIVREGSGDHRAALDAMELNAFDRTLLDGLAEWTGSPVTANDLDGKPMLILTWASWHSGSTASARAAEAMANAFADQGLIVLGVHSDEGYDTAAQSAQRLRLSFPIARDVDKKFRTGLRADMDPNFYVVDRAGQLRFADITRSSVREALQIVTSESREQAAGAQARRAGSNEPTSRVIAGLAEHDVANIPEWDIPPQDAVLYQDADWPGRWESFEDWADTEFDNRGQTELPIIDFNTSLVTWLSKKPNLGGRVRVVYFWSPTVSGSYERVQPLMDEVQRHHGRDVAVIGAAVPIISINRNEARRDPSKLDEALERFASSLTTVMARTQLKHSVVYDRQYELMTSSLGKEVRTNDAVLEMGRDFKYPIVVLYSSDNSVRWIGNPLDDRFKLALNRMVDTDPAVRLRRQRDESYLARQSR